MFLFAISINSKKISKIIGEAYKGKFEGSALHDSTFAGANLTGSSFVGSDVRDTNFAGADLTGSKFTGSDVREVGATSEAVAAGRFVA